jgi:ATP-dependent helicase/DNAse subunit B
MANIAAWAKAVGRGSMKAVSATTLPSQAGRIERPHWSYSQLSQYLRCPLQYYFERIVKLPRAFNSSTMILGSAIHEGLAAYHRQLQQRQPVDAAQVKDQFVAAWQASEDDRFSNDQKTKAASRR